MAGSHLVMVSAFIEAEDAAKAISDPVKRQQMLDGLAKAWEFAKENPGAAGLEGTWAVIKGTVEDAWNVTSHTVESIAQNALGEDPLDAGLASSAALVAAIAFINPIRKGTKAAKALLKRAKEARRVKKSKTAKVGPNSSLGFTADTVDTAFDGMRSGGGHAIRHLQNDGLIPNTGSLSSRVDSFKDLTRGILMNPSKTFDHPLGPPNNSTLTRGFSGTVNGERVVVFVAKEGPYQGRVISSFKPSPQQVSNWGLQ